jgi:two-component system, NarL family, sensor histidine kinase UhpB
VVVSLDAPGPRLVLTVRDDVRGIGRSLAPDTTGVAGMRERARLVGGKLALRDAQGGGAELILDVPLGGSA